MESSRPPHEAVPEPDTAEAVYAALSKILDGHGVTVEEISLTDATDQALS